MKHPNLKLSQNPNQASVPAAAPRPLSRRVPKLVFALSIAVSLGGLVACGTSHKTAEPTGGEYASERASTSRAELYDKAGAPVALGGPQMERERRPSGPPPASPAQKKKEQWNQVLAGADAKEEAAEDEGDWSYQSPQEMNTEAYDSIIENRFISAKNAPLSTFSVDVDTASYSNVRRFLAQGSRPPAGAVRIEELINYFDYQYEQPRGDAPFAVHTEVSTAPWAPEHRLLHIGLQGKRIDMREAPARNLVFLLDVSGSMDEPTKLPLLKRSLRALLDTLGGEDTVSIVVYAGASGMVLPPTSAGDRERILDAFERLQAGGSTNGGEGIELAYRTAERSFKRGGVNRVILATDGDFNVGTTSESELVRLIEQKRKSGVFLTVLGFGMGNYKDSTLEKLADKGNGNYAYIDTFSEARKVLVEEGGANLITIAKDVKIQVEMNPDVVGAYRLIGYENRALRDEDFNDDSKDAGEIGAGHTVTALYEILSPEQASREVNIDPLKYSRPERGDRRGEHSGEMATIKLRYKTPEGERSRLIQYAVKNTELSPRKTSDAFRFSAAVAGFGMLLRDSEYRGNANFRMITDLASGAMGSDPFGHKHEFLGIVSQAARM